MCGKSKQGFYWFLKIHRMISLLYFQLALSMLRYGPIWSCNPTVRLERYLCHSRWRVGTVLWQLLRRERLRCLGLDTHSRQPRHGLRRLHLISRGRRSCSFHRRGLWGRTWVCCSSVNVGIKTIVQYRFVPSFPPFLRYVRVQHCNATYSVLSLCCGRLRRPARNDSRRGRYDRRVASVPVSSHDCLRHRRQSHRSPLVTSPRSDCLWYRLAYCSNISSSLYFNTVDHYGVKQVQ